MILLYSSHLGTSTSQSLRKSPSGLRFIENGPARSMVCGVLPRKSQNSYYPCGFTWCRRRFAFHVLNCLQKFKCLG